MRLAAPRAAVKGSPGGVGGVGVGDTSERSPDGDSLRRQPENIEIYYEEAEKNGWPDQLNRGQWKSDWAAEKHRGVGCCYVHILRPGVIVAAALLDAHDLVDDLVRGAHDRDLLLHDEIMFTAWFCQNWDISKSREMDRLADVASPERIAEAAVRLGCRSVAFTYNDPVVFMEYAIDVADACRERGVKAVAVTAGYMNAEKQLGPDPCVSCCAQA